MLKNNRLTHKTPIKIHEMNVGEEAYIDYSSVIIGTDASVWVYKDGNAWQGIIDSVQSAWKRFLRWTRFLYRLDMLGPQVYRIRKVSEKDFELDLMNWLDYSVDLVSPENICESRYINVGKADLTLCRGRRCPSQ